LCVIRRDQPSHVYYIHTIGY